MTLLSFISDVVGLLSDLSGLLVSIVVLAGFARNNHRQEKP